MSLMVMNSPLKKEARNNSVLQATTVKFVRERIFFCSCSLMKKETRPLNSVKAELAHQKIRNLIFLLLSLLFVR